MSDFADLWNSVTLSTTKKPTGSETLASQLNASRGSGLGTASQPISRVSTPSYLSSQGISPQPSGQAQRTSPRPSTTSMAAKPGTNSNGGDAFGDLFALSGATQSKNMTIAERQAQASREQARAEEQARKEREANGAFWDQLEFSGSRSAGSAPSLSMGSSGMPGASSQPLAPRIETTLLTPSRVTPLPSSKPSTSAVTPASNSDMWDLDSFLAPSKPALPTTTPSASSSPGPKSAQTHTDLFDLLDSLPSGNQPTLDTSSKATPVRTGTPGDFDWGDREDNDDDLLGELSRPASQKPSKPPTPTPPSDYAAERPVPTGRRGSPPPHIIGQIVEMGFSVKEAKRALANTTTGTDVQAALESLLAGGDASQAGSRGPSANDLERFREEDEAARREFEEAEVRGRRRAGASRSTVPEPGDDDTARQLQERADQLLAQASVFGTNMFNRANALWREGKEKAMKAYEERAAGAAGASSGRPRDNTRPAWMQDESPPSREGRDYGMPERSKFRDDDDDSVPPAHPPTQQKRAAPAHQPPQPTIITTAPPRPADKLASLFSDTTAYVSPARRKAPSQTPTSVQPSPAEPRISSPPVVLRTRTNPPVSADILSAVQSHRAQGTEAFKLGQYGTAIDSYTAALQILPEGHLLRIPLLNNRAAARSKTGDASGSIEDCTIVLDVIGDDFEPSRESPIPNVDLGAALVKALRRRAEMLESTEKWKRAREDWERLVKVGGTWAGSKAGSDGVQGVGRCKRMEQGGGAPVSQSRAPIASTRSKPKPRPVPARTTSSKAEDSAVHRLKTANAAAEAEGDQKHALKDSVDARITTWKGGKENNIRALIASLDTVLWPELGWTKVGMHELVMPNQVKIKYVRAIAKVHPDKLNTNSTTVEQRMIANSVFGALNEAWNAFDQ